MNLLKNITLSLVLLSIHHQISGTVVSETLHCEEPSLTFNSSKGLFPGGSGEYVDPIGLPAAHPAPVMFLPPISEYPYYEDFESGSGGWTAMGTEVSWELGQPAGNMINGPSPRNPGSLTAWVTNPDSAYSLNEFSWVQSPVFDFSGLTNPEIVMEVWWDLRECLDGVALQYSPDGGISWHTLGSASEGTNWYTDLDCSDWNADGDFPEWASYNGTNWSGSNIADSRLNCDWCSFDNVSPKGSGNWVIASLPLDELAGLPEVLLRIRLGVFSDEIISFPELFLDGFAFDNVIIRDKPVTDASISGIIDLPSGCNMFEPYTLTARIMNNGSDILNNINLSYEIAGPVPASGTQSFTGVSIASGATEDLSFSDLIDFSTPGTYTIEVSLIAPGDLFSQFDSYTYTLTHAESEITEFPYIEDFESGPGGWTPGGYTNSWQYFNSFDGDHYFKTNSESYMNPAEISMVESPCMDFSSLIVPVIKFQTSWWGDAFILGDILYGMEFSIDNGLTWELIPGSDHWPGPGEQVYSLYGLGGYPSVRFQLRTQLEGGFLLYSPATLDFDDVEITDGPESDLTLLNIEGPLAELCAYSSSETVTAQIANFGTLPQSGFDLSYTVEGPEGSFTITENVGSLVLEPLDTLVYSFSTPADLSDTGFYMITVFHNLDPAPYTYNDSALVEIHHIQTSSIPLSNDFSIPGSESGETKLIFTSSMEDGGGLYFKHYSTFASSSPSGPDPLLFGTDMLALDSDPSYPGDRAVLRSQCISLAGAENPNFDLSYHMYGSSIGSLKVDVLLQNGDVINLLTVEGQQQTSSTDAFELIDLSLLDFVDDTIRLQISGDVVANAAGSSRYGEIAIDDLAVASVCSIPEDLTATTASNGTNAKLEWTPSAGAIKSNVLLANISTGSIVSYGTFNDFKNIGSLIPGTDYGWKVRSLCPAAVEGSAYWTPYTEPAFFTTPNPTSCGIVSGLDAAPAANGTNVTLSWDASPDAVKYGILMINLSTGTSQTFGTFNDFKNIGSLTPGTEYEWKLKTRCPGGDVPAFWTDYSESALFTTPNIMACGIVSGLESLPAPNGTNVALDWDPSPDAIKYSVFMTNLSTGSSQTYGTFNDFKNIGSLTPGTQYQWQVRTQCPGEGGSNFWTDLSVADTFMTADPSLREMEIDGERMWVMPNPFDEVLVVSFQAADQLDTNIRIVDILGRIMFEEERHLARGLNEIRLNPDQLGNGTYLLTISAGNQYRSCRIVRMNSR